MSENNGSQNNDGDGMDLDFGVDPQEANDAVNEGVKKGALAGIQQGAKDKAKEIAFDAGKRAVEALTGQSRRSPIKDAMDDVAEAMKLQAFQQTLNSMQMKNQQQTQASPPAVADPIADFAKMMQTMSQFGIDPNKLVDKIGVQGILAMMNPRFAPFASLLARDEPKSGNNMELLSMFMMMMQNNQKDPPQHQQSGGDQNLLAVLLQNQATMMERLFQAQQEITQAQQRLMLEQIKPFLNRQSPSFADEIGELAEKMDKLQGLGLFGQNRNRSELEAKLDFEARRMAMDLKRDELRIEKELQAKQAEIEAQERLQNQQLQFFNTAQNLFQNIKGELPAIFAPRQNAPVQDQQLAPPPVKASSQAKPDAQPLSRKISSRISNMLRLQEISHDAEADDDAQ